jgi:NAD(P)-dependent dehydrogenase (short-subunit alcohol dehydrogenase family)
MSSLKDKVAIITGSGKGIGKAIALEFAKAGAGVVVNDINLEEAEKVAKEIHDMGGKALAIRADVTRSEEIQEMIKDTLMKFEKIDILVNNAGVITFDSFLDIKEEDLDRTLAVDLKGVFLCSQAVVRRMIEQGTGGKIINIASAEGFIGHPKLLHHCAAKAAVIELTKEMASELAQYKINVNAVGPGIIETDGIKDFLKDHAHKKSIIDKIALKRMGRPEDIAEAVVFLASRKSDYITGKTIFIDGGWQP